jgi:hypothetical protein
MHFRKCTAAKDEENLVFTKSHFSGEFIQKRTNPVGAQIPKYLPLRLLN